MTTKSQRQRIAEAAHHRCGYCLLQEVVSGMPLTIEHLLPKAHGGSDEWDVRDDCALVFAQTFYQHLLQGATIAEATN